MTPNIFEGLSQLPDELKKNHPLAVYIKSEADIDSAIDDASPYEDALNTARNAPKGERNNTVYNAARRIGKLEANQKPHRNKVRKTLLSICDKISLVEEDGREACIATIESGLNAGKQDRENSLEYVLKNLDNLDHVMVQNGQSLTVFCESECGHGERAPSIIKHIISEGDLVCVYGPPGSGKSVFVPYLCSCVGRGAPFFGLKTQMGSCLYVAAEDPSGLSTRIKATTIKHGSSSNVFLVEGMTDLGASDGKQLKELSSIIKKIKPKVVVFDTLAITFPGIDENSAEAMSKVVSITRAITRMNCAVVLIHHDTKSGNGTPRGHSILNAALDFAMLLIAADNSGICLLYTSPSPRDS